MNVERLKLMQTMLSEVVAGTWKPKPIVIEVSDNSNSGNYDVELDTSKKSLDFNLSKWIGSKDTEKSYVCGFTACAVGHATLDQRFNDLGLIIGSNGMPVFGGAVNWDAVEDFFEIGHHTQKQLFSDDWYGLNIKGNNLVNQVIRRIELLIKDGEENFINNPKIENEYSLDKNLKFRKLAQ